MVQPGTQYDLLVSQAQKTVENQIAAGTAIETKLTALVSQSTTLASAALSAAAISTLELGAAKVPDWLSAGLLCVGICWAVAAMIAQYGTRPERWVTATVRPARLFDAKIDVTDRDAIQLELIRSFDRAAERNQKICVQRARSLWAANYLFLLSLPTGAISSGLIYLKDTAWWPIPIVILLYPALAIRFWLHLRATISA